MKLDYANTDDKISPRQKIKQLVWQLLWNLTKVALDLKAFESRGAVEMPNLMSIQNTRKTRLKYPDVRNILVKFSMKFHVSLFGKYLLCLRALRGVKYAGKFCLLRIVVEMNSSTLSSLYKFCLDFVKCLC